jgi:hypothetical protein
MGPGTILHKKLASFGVTLTSSCNCEEHRKTMDFWGPLECRRQIHIIIGWMRAEAKKRNLPFVASAAKLLVLWSIQESEKLLKKAKDPVDTEPTNS